MSADHPNLAPYAVGIRGRCPRCGEGHMFQGFLKLRPNCEACGLDYSYADPADGPAFFAITFACLPSAFFAVWLEAAYTAPYWVHLFTTLPLLLLTCIPPLRPLKGWLVASQYHHKAGEGRLVRKDEAETASVWLDIKSQTTS
ncbi:DUF983 domain-containing protein [Hansschlegelia sp.]|uniref:DUF983 domain-containing protein n=1 Tax=Hansschlegelia sp. TaxID=2041892 RepID=UPI002CF6632A|nr:DUF983 domain-containing protein [Hansschlegelia sp.]HVI27943.1 DUF983 domain-containing protein [Hansschlegelia sp.]